ncbi:MAG: 2-dehydropantoate 2-reductase [Pseudomonadota bacterium]|nr:2-dehydropantoate 2-reductase [Pseudomonadota bacterium]
MTIESNETLVGGPEAARVLVVGAGAVGGFYGSLLARQGWPVSVVCRSEAALVSERGFAIHSDTLGKWRFRPAATTAHVTALEEAPDYLLLTTKVLAGEDRAELIQPAVGPRTVIVLLENGVDIEAPFAAAFPDHELISALAFVCVSRTAPGHIHHQAYGGLTLGNYPTGISGAVRRLAAAFRAAGMPVESCDAIVTARWRKAVWNAAFNPASVLAGCIDTGRLMADDAAVRTIRRAMVEVCEVAAAAGHPLPPQTVDAMLENTRRMPPYLTSMTLDALHGRPLEREAILGAILDRARSAGVPAPTLETFDALLRVRTAN